MVEKQHKKHGRLATALIAGPMLTAGMLGIGVAPAGAAEPVDQQAAVEENDTTDLVTQADGDDVDELDLLDLDVDPTDVPEGSNPHVTTQETPISDRENNVVGYVEQGTVLAIVATDATWPAAPIAGTGDLGDEELYVPDYDEYLVAWEASTDEEESPAEEDEAPADQPEELAETGVETQQLGLFAGLLTALGAAFIAFAHRTRLTAWVSRSRT